MIGKLTGIVDGVGEDTVVIDVAGVGYEVHCPTRTLAGLPPPGGRVSLSIETRMREDAIRLYGFAEPGERAWFRALQEVQGVGAKVALAVLSVLSPAELAQAVAAGDTAMIARAHGVGARVAGRICAELRDKMPAGMAGPELMAALNAPEGGAAQDAVSALVNLGYGRSEAAGAVARAAAAGTEPSAEALIRHGLKELAR
jgi:Holliday junction DNA helicase RuvA